MVYYKGPERSSWTRFTNDEGNYYVGYYTENGKQVNFSFDTTENLSDIDDIKEFLRIHPDQRTITPLETNTNYSLTDKESEKVFEDLFRDIFDEKSTSYQQIGYNYNEYEKKMKREYQTTGGGCGCGCLIYFIFLCILVFVMAKLGGVAWNGIVEIWQKIVEFVSAIF